MTTKTIWIDGNAYLISTNAGENTILIRIRNACRYCWQTIRNFWQKTIILQHPQPAYSSSDVMTSQEQDEDELFGISLALILRHMSPINKNLLKIEIFTLVSAARNRLKKNEGFEYLV